MRRLSLLLLPVGPLCVAFLRYLLPGYSSPDSLATAQAVIDHPGRESAVLWLGLVAMLTLVPGLITVAGALPDNRWKFISMTLCIPGYLALGPLLAGDQLLFSGAAAKIGAAQIAAELNAMHPSAEVATTIFVFGHVVGTVLLGGALFRSRLIAPWAAGLVAVEVVASEPATVPQ